MGDVILDENPPPLSMEKQHACIESKISGTRQYSTGQMQVKVSSLCKIQLRAAIIYFPYIVGLFVLFCFFLTCVMGRPKTTSRFIFSLIFTTFSEPQSQKSDTMP